MRSAFVKALSSVAANDDRIVFLTADLGYKLFDDFAARFPGRFINVGIAEATMVGVACGLALEGKKPIIYSIVPFATARCYEQIRNDICYHSANVTIVGIGGGYSYGVNGPTHHAIEDIAIMRALPGMTVVCPGDGIETTAALRALSLRGGPAYLRLDRTDETNVHPADRKLEIGRAITIREGQDLTLVSTGGMLAIAIDAAERLRRRGIECRVLSMHTVKPLDAAAIHSAARETRVLATLEEHSIIGGLGSAVAEELSTMSSHTRLFRFGIQDHFSSDCGSRDFHRQQQGLSARQVCEALTQHMN